MIDMASQPIYALRIAQVLDALETSSDGLTPQEAQARLTAYGRNTISEPPGVSLHRKLIGHATHTMALLLWAAGGVAILSGQHGLGIVIWIVVLVNAGFSFWQEHRAEEAVAALKKLLPPCARVIREGREIEIPADEVVPGDMLVLAEGDNIPADARVVEEYGLRANYASLTGEAVPLRKVAEASLREGLTELERPNLVFAGTSVVSGTGRAVVFATGMTTQFGRIANLTQAVKEEPSRLQQDMARATQKISMVAVGLGVIVFTVGLTDLGLPEFQALIFAIGIIVAVIPEGLLPTVTLALAIAVQRLAQRGVLVKKLAVVETLASTSVICTDKSGTLTQNQMTVSEVWVAGERLRVSGVGYEPIGSFYPPPSDMLTADLQALLTAATLCNNSRLNPPSSEHPHWTSLGDQTEAALRVVAIKGQVEEKWANRAYPRVHELPFDARRKRMSTIHQAAGRRSQDANEIAFVKGAPKEVLQLCTHILICGEVRPLDDATRAEILAANDDYARNALRVLALARREISTVYGGESGAAQHRYSPEAVERDLMFLGLLAMMDPPRPEVAEAVKACSSAGIRMVMVTGDYGLTAESVARRVGMLTTQRPRIMTGGEVDGMDDAALQAALGEEAIFARMAPEHKLRLVAAFQARGEVVAVTGDGVNDVPALRKADIGIVMGVTGTDVAKEAGDVILTGDNFSAIAHAIEEGRAVYDNLRKFITYIFASNVPEIMPFILAALFNIPLALTVAQILAIDLGTDLLPALALGTERPEPNVMNRPPRRREQSLMDGGLLARALWLGVIETVLCYAGFFGVYRQFGFTDWLHLPHTDWLPFASRLAAEGGAVYILATTVFHAGVVTAQIGNAFACRTEKEMVRRMGLFSNRFLLGGVAIEVALILLMIYLSPLARVFEHLPLPPGWWAGLLLFAPAVYGLEWIRKHLVRVREQLRGSAPRLSNNLPLSRPGRG
jgi:Ca2+-transporting ATPase